VFQKSSKARDGLHRRLAPRRRDPTGDDEVVDLDAVCGKDRCQHRKNQPGKKRKTTGPIF
jgi:hypothetical protein